MNFNFDTSVEFAMNADENDSLKHFQERFFIPDKNTIYLDGNSLGILPAETKELISEIVEKQWGTELIGSWNKHWYEKPSRLGDKIAQIIGADPGEVIVTDSTSVNLYKLAHAALRFQKGKIKVVSDVFNFPTDLYILQGILNGMGSEYKLVLADSNDGISIDLDDLKEKTDNETALVVLSLVSFKSSFLYNAKQVTDWAHEKGALMLWDLSHAAGAVTVELNKTGADLAIGCTYKYLNGGPGSPAFLYVRKDLQEKLSSPLQGWFGHNNPFQFSLNYEPAPGIKKFLAGTPPVISLLAAEPGIELICEAGIKNLRMKSISQTEYFRFLANKILIPYGFTPGSPADFNARGSHISLKHQEGYRICQALVNPEKTSQKVIPDFREPDNIRFGIAPLYTTFTNIWQTIFRLREIVDLKEFETFSSLRNPVT